MNWCSEFEVWVIELTYTLYVPECSLKYLCANLCLDFIHRISAKVREGGREGGRKGGNKYQCIPHFVIRQINIHVCTIVHQFVTAVSLSKKHQSYALALMHIAYICRPMYTVCIG